MSKPPQKAGSSAAASKAKALKFIPKTVDLLRGNDAAKRKGKGKEKRVLGGLADLVKTSESLPGAVHVERFAETRAVEILALQNAVKLAASQSNSRAFQSLPRHLRRRAASHNPRRVPKRMRSRAAAELDPADPGVRIYRKKAKRRARGNLRGQSRTEQLRARQRNKRWLGTHLFHAKRFHMVNLWGYRLPLSPTLKSFRSSYRAARRKAVLHDTSYFGTIELEGPRSEIVGVLGKVTVGGAFAGSKYEFGARMAQTNIYTPGSVPHGLIGPVELFWQPQTDINLLKRRLWMRVHPSIFDDVLKALHEAAEDGASEARSSNAGPSLNIRNLRDDIESFEIMGPLAGKVIQRALHMCKSEGNDKRSAVSAILHADPAACPEGAVLGTTVYDPRLFFPPPRLSEDDIPSNSTTDPLSSLCLAPSELWDSGKRNLLLHPKFKKSDLDLRRHKLGIPGTRLQPGAEDDRIPILIVKRTVESRAPDHESSAFHGYTLLLPRGWSMAFLPSFIFCNVRLAGLSERRVQYREAAVPSFPEHYGAVCPAGTAWEEELALSEQQRWLRKPPGKRPEYSTLGTKWPFKPEWPAVLSTSTEIDIDETSAKRDPKDDVKPWLANPILGKHVNQLNGLVEPSSHVLAALNAFRKNRGLVALEAERADNLLRSGVCHVEVNIIGRGSPSDMAMIYALDSEERTRWLDAYEHDLDANQIKSPLDDHVGQMLRLGEEGTGASRVIGFVSTGNISLTRGQGHALATVSLAAYLGLLSVAETSTRLRLPVVKLKNRDGLVCRLASLSLVQ